MFDCLIRYNSLVRSQNDQINHNFSKVREITQECSSKQPYICMIVVHAGILLKDRHRWLVEASS